MQVLYGHHPFFFYFARLDSDMRPECDDNTQDTFAFFYSELPSKICYAFFYSTKNSCDWCILTSA